MIRRFVSTVSVAGTLTAAACTAPVSVAQSFNFNRPADSASLCMRVPVQANGYIDIAHPPVATPLTLDQCTGLVDVDPNTSPTTARRLFALVTQSDRGELAVVNTYPTLNTGIVDNNRSIPGYTFIPVGAFPSAVAVHPTGRAVFVANAGGTTVTFLDSARLLTSGPFALDGADGQPIALDVGGHPFDLALYAAKGHVILRVLVGGGSEPASVRSYDVTDPTHPSAPAIAVLANTSTTGSAMDGGSGDAADAVALDGGEGADGGLTGAVASDPEHLAISTEDGTVYVSDRALPIVHVLVTDGNADTMLTEVAPLLSGVGTLAIAVTPTIVSLEHVPGTVDSPGVDGGVPMMALHHPLAVTGKRFVYASTYRPGDETHELVAIDTTTRLPVRANLIADDPDCIQGSVDPVLCPKLDVHLGYDRVPIGGAALGTAGGRASVLSLSVSTRDAIARDTTSADTYCATPSASDTTDPAHASTSNEDCANAATPGVRVLRGVQVLAGLQGGEMQVIDLVDPDRICPNRMLYTGTNAALENRALLPHLPRSVTTPTARVGLLAPVQFYQSGLPVVEGESEPVLVPFDENGAIPSAEVRDADSGVPATPAVANRPGCDAMMRTCVVLAALPGQESSDVIHREIDPVLLRDDTYVFTAEGIVPGLSQSAGTFDAGPTSSSLVVRAPGARICTRGALAGDHFTIPDPSMREVDPNIDAGIRPLPSTDATCNADRCTSIFGTAVLPCNRDFVITEARDERLTIEVTPGDVCGPPRSPEELIADLRCCYPVDYRFEVRSPPSQWIAQSALRGFEHAVRVGADGTCEATPLSAHCDGASHCCPAGRLCEQQTFTNGLVTLRIEPGYDRVSMPMHRVATPRDRSFTFSTTNGYQPLFIDVGPRPVSTHYSCPNQLINVVDQGRAQITEFTVLGLDSPVIFN